MINMLDAPHLLDMGNRIVESYDAAESIQILSERPPVSNQQSPTLTEGSPRHNDNASKGPVSKIGMPADLSIDLPPVETTQPKDTNRRVSAVELINEVTGKDSEKIQATRQPGSPKKPAVKSPVVVTRNKSDSSVIEIVDDSPRKTQDVEMQEADQSDSDIEVTQFIEKPSFAETPGEKKALFTETFLDNFVKTNPQQRRRAPDSPVLDQPERPTKTISVPIERTSSKDARDKAEPKFTLDPEKYILAHQLVKAEWPGSLSYMTRAHKEFTFNMILEFVKSNLPKGDKIEDLYREKESGGIDWMSFHVPKSLYQSVVEHVSNGIEEKWGEGDKKRKAASDDEQPKRKRSVEKLEDAVS